MATFKTNAIKRVCAVVLALFFVLNGFVGFIDFRIESSAADSTVENYYKNLNDNCEGDEFRANLARLITETHHTNTTYDGLREAYKKADYDPDKSGNIILFYTGTSVPFNGSFGDVNREHVWPKNAGNAFPAESKAGSDAHHLRPCDQTLNSSRGSKSFGEVPQTTSNIVSQNGSKSYNNLCYSNGSLFYPGEGYRGATARILMYVQVRWGDEFNLIFVDSAGSNKTIGKISDLMKWHLQEPPTEEEIRRNEAVFKMQGNRNPFIDHPEYAEKIFCYDGESYNSKLKSVVEEYGNYETPDITSVSLSPSTLNLAVGQSATVNVSVLPTNAAKSLAWTSSNPSVATVTNGVVKALQTGSVTITATAKNNSSIKDSVTVNVKSVASMTVSGTLAKTKYYAGEAFSPAGLTVLLTYSDGSNGLADLSVCQWLDGNTMQPALSLGTTSVVCKYGVLTYIINGISVQEAQGKTVSITKSDVPGTGAYGFYTWTDSGISGEAYIYASASGKFQFNSSKPSFYFYNTTPLPGGLISITMKMESGSKSWELRTSSTAYTQVSQSPATGTSQGTKTVTESGVTWTVNTSDPYFTLNYKDTGVAYVKEIIITYGSSSPSGDEHTYGTWQNEIPATCTQAGTKGHYFCTHCNGFFDSSKNPIAGVTIPALGHSFGSWVISRPATETETGEKTRECSVCHEVETVTVPVTGGQSAFADTVNELSVATGSIAEFSAIREAFLAYEALTTEEKDNDAEAYADLQTLAAAYNALANKPNDAISSAAEIAIRAFSASAISLGAVLWLVSRRFRIGG